MHLAWTGFPNRLTVPGRRAARDIGTSPWTLSVYMYRQGYDPDPAHPKQSKSGCYPGVSIIDHDYPSKVLKSAPGASALPVAYPRAFGHLETVFFNRPQVRRRNANSHSSMHSLQRSVLQISNPLLPVLQRFLRAPAYMVCFFFGLILCQ
ncbi:hypothetical protein BV20DRAFT_763290 [Pilatotrama ljubarskyi]|nr:hypothetical protein BV20DRAFT_763290 [Pilatotrama ljubarskyi]